MKKALSTVQLTELEFHKLLRYSELANSAQAQAETMLKQMQARVGEAQKVRDAFVDTLVKKYPVFDKSVTYTPNEDTFELQPVPVAD